MKEKYESLPLSELREIAKAANLKKISGLRKAELIERLLELGDATIQSEANNKEKNEDVSSQQELSEKQAESDDLGKIVSETTAENAGQQPDQAGTPDENTRKSEIRKKHAESSNKSQTERIPKNRRNERAGQPSKGDRVAQSAKAERLNRSSKNERNSQSSRGERSNQPAKNERNSQFTRTDRMNQSAGDDRADQPLRGEHVNQSAGTEHVDQTMETGRTEVLSGEMAEIDSGEKAGGILEVMSDGYGFIRCENYLPGENDVYVSPSQIRRFNLKTGDIVVGNKRIKTQNEKFSALLFIESVNGLPPYVAQRRTAFEDLTPIFPDERIHLETPGCRPSMRIVDLISPVGKGQRGMIVAQPKAGKTTLLKEIATSVKHNNPEMHLIILLIDERPEEVTDIKEAIEGENVEVIYSTFDELPEHHKRVSEMVIERAKRLVEHKQDVIILLDSITRLARAYNLVVPPSGRTLSGGLDPAALHMPKRFFGAARNMREGGSLTILATALVETGSKMDDVVYEEFKGTGNMELVLDRSLSERRIFPAIDILKSGTRRDDLLLDKEEQEAMDIIRRGTHDRKKDEVVENILQMFVRTRTNKDLIRLIKSRKYF